jgi:hypothetical protein
MGKIWITIPFRLGQNMLCMFFDVSCGASKDNIDVTLICPGFVQTNVANNALTADGSKAK